MGKELDLNTLGQVLDTTWGKSSTGTTATRSIKTKLHGENLTVYYVTIVNMTSDRESQRMKEEYTDEADSILKEFISKIKSEYKEKTKKSLTLKEVNKESSIEIISLNSYNGLRTAYFRRFLNLKVS